MAVINYDTFRRLCSRGSSDETDEQYRRALYARRPRTVHDQGGHEEFARLPGADRERRQGRRARRLGTWRLSRSFASGPATTSTSRQRSSAETLVITRQQYANTELRALLGEKGER